jgi:hypothetical protein
MGDHPGFRGKSVIGPLIRPRLLSALRCALLVLASLGLSAEANATAAIAQPGTAYKKYEVPIWRLLEIPEVKDAYQKALARQTGVPRWVRRLEVVGTTGRAFATESELVFVYRGNKIKEGHKNLTIAYDPKARVIGVKLTYYYLERDQVEWERIFGRPTPFMRRLMAAEQVEDISLASGRRQ